MTTIGAEILSGAVSDLVQLEWCSPHKEGGNEGIMSSTHAFSRAHMKRIF